MTTTGSSYETFLSPPAARRVAAVLLIAAAVVAGGCGYALVGRGTNLPEDVRRVYLEPLENRTQRSQVEQFLSQAIADELVTRQRLTLVSEAAGADAVLSGTVLGFGVTPVSFDAEGRATEYELSITARMVFRRTGTEGDAGVLWSSDRYLFRDSYEVPVSEIDYFDQENIALEDVAENFAELVVSDLLEGF